MRNTAGILGTKRRAGSYTLIDKLSFDAYNEGEASEFEQVVEKYCKRFGHYPERILADNILYEDSVVSEKAWVLQTYKIANTLLLK